MKKQRLQILTLTFILFLLSSALYAENKSEQNILDMSIEMLPNIVVTDTKVAQNRNTVTQNIEIVNSDEIDRYTNLNRNISELLLYKADVFVNTLSRNDANWGSFGGLGPKYNSYLLDGLPIDSFVDAMSLDPWIFDRVELYKGPASVMYSNYSTMDFAGNETPLAGITNFVLKDSIDAPLDRVQIGSGSYGTKNGKFYHQNTSGNVNYFFGTNYEESNYTNYGNGATNSWLTTLSDPQYKNNSLYGKMSYHFDPEGPNLSLFFYHTMQNGDRGRPNRDFNNVYDTINLAYNNQLNEAFNLQIKGGYRGYLRQWDDDNFPVNLDLKDRSGVEQQIIPVDVTVNFKHLGESLLSFGTDAQAATYMTNAEINNVTTTNNKVSSLSNGIFVQEKLNVDKWVFRAGGRYNVTKQISDTIDGVTPIGTNEKSWSQPVWSIGTRYNASSSIAFYGNAGTSFVVPSAKQVLGTIPINNTSLSGQLPNSGLKEENGLGSDLGLEWHPFSVMNIGARGFVNQINNAIIDNVVSQAPSQTQSVNAGTASSYGVEVTLDSKMNKNLQCFANVTHILSKVNNPLDTNNDGTEIPFVPDYVTNAGITANLPWEIIISPYLHMVGNYYDSTSRSGRNKFGTYLTANIKIYKQFIKGKNSVDGLIDLNNITNQRYEMPWGFRDPGFNVFFGIEADIF